MLTARGLRPIRRFWHMQMESLEGSRAGARPKACEITGVEPA